MSDDYEVGYGKPPKATRFQKGQSGNPRGRPREKTSAEEILRSVFFDQIQVRENGRVTRQTALEVVLKALRNRALEGDRAATSQFIKLYPMLAGSSPMSSDENQGASGIMSDDDILREIARMTDSDPATLFVGKFDEQE